MKQKFILAFLTMLICMGGMGVGAQNNERLSFGVISDIHFDNRVGEGAMVKVPKALKNLTSHKALDALAVVGDLADSGAASQYEMLTSVFSDKANFTNPVGTFLFMMGNHDNFDANGKSNFQEGLKSFNGGEPYPLHSYRVIKGYPFITISMSAGGSNDVSNSSTGKAAYPDDAVRLRHILEHQVYGFAPSHIIYSIAIAYIFGFDKAAQNIAQRNFVDLDVMEYVKHGKLDEVVQEQFGDNQI